MNETSPWYDITPWDNPISEDLWPNYYMIGIELSPDNFGEAFQVNWAYQGNYYYFNKACLDDVLIVGDNPPDTPIIKGQKIFKVGEGGESTYTIYSIDPEGNNIFYEIKWGDGIIDYLGPYESGLNVSIDSHIPLNKGTYVLLKIRAKDVFGAESDWATFSIYVVSVKPTLLLGSIKNVEKDINFSIVKVKSLLIVRLIPFNLRVLSSGKNIVISNDYFGFVGSYFMIGKFETDFV